MLRSSHAKAAGAFGYFEVTNDVSAFTRAGVFNGVGTRTNVITRFSAQSSSRGTADTFRDAKGIAVKFYTSDGNYDLIGLNTRVGITTDGTYFLDNMRASRCPVTGLPEPDSVFRGMLRNPESLYSNLVVYSDIGITDGFRHTNYDAMHTFKWVNANDDVFWVKYHFETENGIQNLTVADATETAGVNADYGNQDFYDSIENGENPSWILSVQIMPEADAVTYEWDINDSTKEWPITDYPRTEVGRLMVNKIAQDYNIEIEVLGFNPGNIVDGIELSNDIVLRQRIFAYQDAFLARAGRLAWLYPTNLPHGTNLTDVLRESPGRVD